MKWFAVFGLAAAALFSSPVAQAQSWPQKPIRMIVPFSAGGPSDAIARALANALTESLGQQVVVDNRTGAGGSLGIDLVVKSPPDGYTLGFAHTGSMAVNPHLYRKHPFDPLTQLTAITPVVAYTNVLVVNPSIPVKNVREFVAWAKANPVKATIASGGNGATNHLAAELLKSLTGAPLTHIPYKGNAPAMNDVIGGSVAAMFDIPTTAIPQINGGKVRALATVSAKRSAFLPDVPTMDEAGVAGYADAGSDLWFGLVAPHAVPQPIVDRIYTEVVRALKTPALRQTVRQMAYEVWTMPPGQFKAFLEADYVKWGKVVRLSGATLE
ncbi:Bug family tripartite tricarboxylate transporter substrate binding protein [Piscinibacter koreensis]|uniref:Tripartite tricarboxylate transporter substrate binding protein n=1 Tax=Piscinibacter koreensis TaxID=2742824 RepID=A0A7Y6TYC5_9BURK|nr:tripartite tricarboxylate transporter substrate binding protein [Schlegelella koreensis]NUZ07952.1 tripartite tricarboxylate transporter substrate binding protein [Schlegelella koreensis]